MAMVKRNILGRRDAKGAKNMAIMEQAGDEATRSMILDFLGGGRAHMRLDFIAAMPEPQVKVCTLLLHRRWMAICPPGPIATAEASTTTPRARNHQVRQRAGQLRVEWSGARPATGRGRNHKNRLRT